MTKANMYDSVLDGIMEVVEDVSTEISLEFKGVNPFDKEPISEEEMLLEYNIQGEQTFNQIANTQGLPAGINYIREMESLKRKIQERRTK